MTQDDTPHTYYMQPRQFHCSFGRLGCPRPPRKETKLRYQTLRRFRGPRNIATIGTVLLHWRYLPVLCFVHLLTRPALPTGVAIVLRNNTIIPLPSPSMYRLTGITNQHRVRTVPNVKYNFKPRCSSGKRGHYQPTTLHNTII